MSGDSNAVDDVFVRDLTAGTTTRVSVGASAAQADGSSGAPAISANGGVVAFESSASNLVAGDTNAARDVFVRNVSGATTTRASVSNGGVQGSGASSSPSISADGSRVAFESTAAFASGDDNNAGDIYVRISSSDTTTWATAWAAKQGWTTGGASSSPSMSGNGRYVTLVLYSDVHLQDLNRASDIYEYDLAAEQWAYISADDVVGPGNKASDAPSVSSDGIHTAFASHATNFDVDTNEAQDAFVHTWLGDPVTGRLEGQLPQLPDQGTPGVPRPPSLSDPSMCDTTGEEWQCGSHAGFSVGGFAQQAAGEQPTTQQRVDDGAAAPSAPAHCSVGKPAAPSDPSSTPPANDESPDVASLLLVEKPHSCKVERESKPPRGPHPPVREDPEPYPPNGPAPPRSPVDVDPTRPKDAIVIFRRVAGSKNSSIGYYRAPLRPGDFRYDPDGVSMFEAPVAPAAGKPYLVPYYLVGTPPAPVSPGATAKVEHLPCTATFTPQYGVEDNGPHWSVDCGGEEDTVAELRAAAVAKRAQGLVKCNPLWQEKEMESPARPRGRCEDADPKVVCIGGFARHAGAQRRSQVTAGELSTGSAVLSTGSRSC